MSNENYFRSDPDWEAFALGNGYPLLYNAALVPIEELKPLELDFKAARARQLIEHAEWRAKYPPESVGYVSRLETLRARDGFDLNVKISYPVSSRLMGREKEALPVVFVTHGGGWIQGTHTTEEAWLLWPLYEHFNLVIVSVEYRLGPEHPYPTWIHDSWDVLEKILSGNTPIFTALDVILDLSHVILAGSSAGAGISAALSHICRDKNIPISGVILNVPVLCDYRHLSEAQDASGYPINSYSEGSEAILSSGAMIWIWNMLHPSPKTSANPQASPLLGECAGLPRHMIFIAGQDALRDEGIAYAKKLEKAGVQSDLEIYKGVPHIFSEVWELQATKRFWDDIRRHLHHWLGTEN